MLASVRTSSWLATTRNRTGYVCAWRSCASPTPLTISRAGEECDCSVEIDIVFDFSPAVPYRTAAMNARASTFDTPTASDVTADANGGLSAFALSFPGYAYFYFYFYPFKVGGM